MVIRPASEESILLIGYSAEPLAGLAPLVPDGSVLVIEEPDVARRRELHAEVAGMPAVSRLAECPYQLAGALPAFLSGSGRRPVAAILPGIEYAVEAAASGAVQLGLPGAGTRAAGVFRNKHLLRHMAESAGIRSPRHALAGSPAAAKDFLAAVGGRCVLKPTGRQGSLGVQYVESPAEIEAGWAMTSHPVGGAVVPERGIPSEVLAEEAVTGPEFSVEMLISGQDACFANVTAKHVFPGRFPVEQGHDVPAPLPARDTELLAEATARLAEAAKMSDGILHAEWIMHDGEPVLVECAARIPGGRITQLISFAYDFSLIGAYLDVMLGNAPVVPAAALHGAAIRYLTAPPGVIAGITGADEAAGMPGVAEVHLQMRPGDTVRPLTVSGNRLGYVLVQADGTREAASTADAALARIHITTEPGTPR
jgi:biotin carboxylase